MDFILRNCPCAACKRSYGQAEARRLARGGGRLRRVDAQGRVSSQGSWGLDGLVVDHGRFFGSSVEGNSVVLYDPQTGRGEVLAGDYMFQPPSGLALLNLCFAGASALFNAPLTDSDRTG